MLWKQHNRLLEQEILILGNCLCLKDDTTYVLKATGVNVCTYISILRAPVTSHLYPSVYREHHSWLWPIRSLPWVTPPLVSPQPTSTCQVRSTGFKRIKLTQICSGKVLNASRVNVCWKNKTKPDVVNLSVWAWDVRTLLFVAKNKRRQEFELYCNQTPGGLSVRSHVDKLSVD